MSAAGRFLCRTSEGYAFWCPGCKEGHQVRVGVADRPCWTFNDNEDAPTFSPSVLVTSGHFMAEHKGGRCWCTFNAEHPDDISFSCFRCHSFVTDGRIQFLSDCSHPLAGQTVDLPPWPAGEAL